MPCFDLFYWCLKGKYNKAAAVFKLRKFVCEYRCGGYLWKTRLCPCDIEFSITYNEIVINNLSHVIRESHDRQPVHDSVMGDDVNIKK